MDQPTAQFWLDVLAGGAGLLWLCGAWFVVRTRQLTADPLRGEAEVPSPPAAVLTQVARQLAGARHGSPLQRCTIEAATAREVRWNTTGLLRHRGSLQATGDQRRTRVAWEVEGGRTLQHVALAVVLVGAVFTVALYAALQQYAVTNEQPAVRAQVVQMVQAIHLLWPPFLFAGLARRQRSNLADEVRRAVQNTPFVAGNGPSSAGRA